MKISEAGVLVHMDTYTHTYINTYAHTYINAQVGDVKISEASVLVQVISGHRKESFEATIEIMNKLKSKVYKCA